MKHFHPVRYPAAALAAAGAALSGAAEAGRVDQVERAEAEAGETEFELQAVHIPPAGGEAAVWAGTLTLEHGLSEAVALGLEIETEAEDGAAPEVESIGVQARFVGAAGRAARFGVQAGLSFDPDTGRAGSETFLIAEARRGGLDLVANAVIETEPGDWGEVTAGYGLRADHPAGEGLVLGLEAGGGLSGEGSDAHWIGPVLGLWPEADAAMPAVELSLFLPLTAGTPDLQIRLALARAF